MYIKIRNNVPQVYTLSDLKKDNPQVSFPEDITEALLADYDVYPVTVLPVPVFDTSTHKLVQTAPYYENGIWQISYAVEPQDSSLVEETVRAKRDRLLAQSDWTQVADAPVDKQSWATYRQQLRDITTQPGFPYTVAWPTKPE